MTLNNHTGSITALDFSEPYGTLVSAASDESVRVWDLCSGEEVGRLRGHVGPVKAIQVDDQLCLTGGADGAIRLWDLRKVEDYEDRLASDEGGERGVKGEHIGGGATGGGAAPLEVLDGLMREEGAEVGPTEGLQPVAEEKDGNPCIRVLEGHSKSVTSLYYEEGCLVSCRCPLNSRELLSDVCLRPTRSQAPQTRRSASGTLPLASAFLRWTSFGRYPMRLRPRPLLRRPPSVEASP